MSPSFSSKNGVRYRFYVSSALLRGRKDAAGSIGRIAATDIENALLAALKARQPDGASLGEPGFLEKVERVVVARNRLLITIADTTGEDRTSREFTAAWVSSQTMLQP